MQRVIVIPCGARVPIGAYVRAWRIARAAEPEVTILHGQWDQFDTTARRVLRDMRAGLDARINAHIPGYGIGRKWSDQWQRDALLTARAVNTPRLIVRWIPRDLRAKLAHRIWTEED